MEEASIIKLTGLTGNGPVAKIGDREGTGSKNDGEMAPLREEGGRSQLHKDG